MATIDGVEQLFVFNGVHAVDLTAKFISHTDATKNHKDPDIDAKKKEYEKQLVLWNNDELAAKPIKPIASLEFFSNPNTFDATFPYARKVTVLPHGAIRNANS